MFSYFGVPFIPVVPHITDAIQECVVKQAKVPVDDDDVEPQVCVIEVSCSAHFIVSLCAALTVHCQHCHCVCLQLGGTVGDIESMPFIEAFRQFQFKVKRENFCNIHVSLIPQVRQSTVNQSTAAHSCLLATVTWHFATLCCKNELALSQ